MKEKVEVYLCTCLVPPDPCTTSPAGSLTLMGQDGAFSGYEVPGGEVVQLLGKPAKHLLLGPASPQRCVDKSYTGS